MHCRARSDVNLEHTEQPRYAHGVLFPVSLSRGRGTWDHTAEKLRVNCSLRIINHRPSVNCSWLISSAGGVHIGQGQQYMVEGTRARLRLGTSKNTTARSRINDDIECIKPRASGYSGKCLQSQRKNGKEKANRIVRPGRFQCTRSRIESKGKCRGFSPTLQP